MCMVVWMPLNSKQNWARKRIPRVHFVDRFVYTILILLSKETVVLNIVDQFQKEHSHACIVELIFKRWPSKEEEDSSTNRSMDDEVSYHFVIE